MMKKIILLLFALFLSFSAFSQFPNPGVEGFENTTGPDVPGQTSVWTLGTGAPGNQWAVFDNGLGTGRWGITTAAGTVHQGVNSGYMNRVNVGINNTSLHYLATPLVTIPANGQLRFWSRTFTLGNNGTLYDIKATAANPAVADQTNPAAYTNNLITYTEDDLTTDMQGNINPFNVYTLKTLNFPPSMYNTLVYLSFVRRNTQQVAGPDGDRFMIDDIQLVPRCLEPTTLTTEGLFATGAELTWANPSGATSWEIQVLPAAVAPTGTGVIYSGPLPYLATATTETTPAPLTPTTQYKYYVRAICSGTGTNMVTSDWVGPTNFTTSLTPPACGGVYSDPGGPTANYANNITGSNGLTTIFPTVPGNLVTVTFTSFATQANLDILRVYDGDFATPSALLGTYSGATLPPSITSSAANGSLTFAFVSNASVQGAGWVANVTCGPPPPCPKPTALVLSNVASSTANLTFTNVGPATSWEYIVQPCTAAPPTAASVGTPISSTSVLLTGLTQGSCYTVYVRANCTSTSNGLSDWSTGASFNTLPTCGGTFVDPGGASANYPNNSNSTTVICGINTGDIVTVTFTAFALENNIDFLKVYDGPSATGFPQIANVTGTAIPGPFTGTSASGCLTFVFTSDGSGQAAGWVANVTCTAPPPCPKPTALTLTGVVSNSATLSWTNVGPGTSWQVLALPCTAAAPNASTTGWIAVPGPATTYTFTTLNAATCYNFYVRADCTSTSNGLSLWSGPLSATTPVAPPVCGGNYVDPGGPTANYGNNITAATGTTTICPPTGQQTTVSFGTFATEPNLDVLAIYNGSVVTPTALLGTFSGTVSPGTFTSSATDGCLTFVFTTDGSVTAAGWVANVTCAPPPTCAKPTNLVATITGATTATLSWTQPANPGGGTPTQWQVIVQLAGTGAPLPGATGTIVNGTPSFLASGLTPNSTYEFWVQAICPPNDSSPWAGPKPFLMASSCSSSQPFCGNTGLTYPNTTGQPSYGNIGCLFTTPNPAWYFMQVNQAGNLNFQIAQTNGTGGGLDVDFICWGPFTPAQYAAMCSNLYDFPDGNTTLPNNVVACSYSAAPIENFVIPNAVSGNFYMVLITNFSNQTGTVTFNQTGGTGNTNCQLVCSVDVGPPSVTLCQGTPYTITATTQGATGYAWYLNGSTTPIPGQSASTLTVTQAGNYTCIITCGLNTAQDTIQVNYTAPVAPTFTLPSTVCQGLQGPILPTSSSDTTPITGTWSPATVDTSVLGSTVYTFTPAAGQCAAVLNFTIAIVPGSVVPTFNPIPNICQGLPAPALPAASADTPAITGTWSPATIDTSIVGPATYTFTPSAGQCATTATLTVTIDAPSIVPTFNQIANICQGLPAPALPTSSTNQPTAITGTWSPATISTATVGTTTYTFTPAAGQCAVTTTMNITIDAPSIVPTFTQIANICQGLPAPTLPTSSTNQPTAITGSWSPATISTATVGTTTYTFTPDPGQCAVVTTMNITIDAPSIVPTFTQIASICQGFAAPALPTASTNQPTAITGSWSPATISTATVGTTTYTFTPDAGQCATTTTMNITINAPSTVPQFAQIPSICLNGTAPALPTTSQNAITGSWSPATINTTVAGPAVYTFTPDPLQCAVSTTMTVTINAPTVATFNQIAAICQGGTLPVLPTSSTNSTAIVGTWSPATINPNPGTNTYTFTPNAGQCALGTTMQITVHPTPVLAPVSNVDVCDSYTLPPLAVGNYFSSPGGVGPITNLTLTSTQQVYVYAQSGTTPNCTDQDSFMVNVTPSPSFVIQGGCQNSVYVLQVAETNFDTSNATYVWTGPNGLPNSNTTSTLEAINEGIYTVTVSVSNGTSNCTGTQTFDTTGNDCEIPKGISPNNDTRNDYFDLSGFNVGKLSIFNRYGKAVYTKYDYIKEWGGQSDSGNELPDGTYYYVIERKDGGDTRTGWVFINRQLR